MSLVQNSSETIRPNSIGVATRSVSSDQPRDVAWHSALGQQLVNERRFAEAEICFRTAIELGPDNAQTYNNMGWVRAMQGAGGEAAAYYQKALQLNPGLRPARRNLATLLVRLGRREQSLHLWHQEMQSGDQGIAWMNGLISNGMRERDLALAGEYAAILAALRWGSRWRPPFKDGSIAPPALPPAARFLTIPKLQHDIEQFLYLQDRGVLGDEFTQVIDKYRAVIDRLAPRGPNIRVRLEPGVDAAIGYVYNRIVHVRDTPRVSRALSDTWNPAAVEKDYLDRRPGVVVVDDFLSREALENVRLFCLESTVWSANRYAYGRLGAFFHDGFNCPLLLQIAEELRTAMARVIGDQYPLRQLWGFKNGQHLPGDSTTHADFAAVNVNFWITPDDANLNPGNGGLIVYGVDAPLHWDFLTYNGRSDIIKPFLRQQEARFITIPYKQNRAIIFNSDLFHGTEELNFRPGYENRRINITMLYGERENDVHHRHLARQGAMSGYDEKQTGWRSAAFARSRRSHR